MASPKVILSSCRQAMIGNPSKPSQCKSKVPATPKSPRCLPNLPIVPRLPMGEDFPCSRPTLRNPSQGGLQCARMAALLFALCCLLGRDWSIGSSPSAAKHLNTNPQYFEWLLFVFVACLTIFGTVLQKQGRNQGTHLSVNASAGT